MKRTEYGLDLGLGDTVQTPDGPVTIIGELKPYGTKPGYCVYDTDKGERAFLPDESLVVESRDLMIG